MLDIDSALHNSWAMPKPSPDELLTASQAGRILDRSYRTVHRFMEQGELPCAMKVPGPNGAYLFRRGDVEKLAAKRAAKASLTESQASA